MRVLGIETSCDETSVAIYSSNHGLIAHQIFSQVDLHARYGGVVPELASRDHIRKTLPLIDQTLKDAGLTKKDIDGIAYTAGPGLIGALLVGATIGRSLAWALNIPAVNVHHLEGHLLAVMLEDNRPTFPFLALLVSGGHTLLIHVSEVGKYQILGESLDDAAGEAFDKTAKVLGLGYPGGAALAKLAEQGQPGKYRFSRPMVDRPGLDFSFSGLKTAALNAFQQSDQSAQTRADIARAFQDTLVDTLIIKTKRALEQSGLKQIVVAGGVGANQSLRESLQKLATERGGQVFFPRPLFCTDNGAMIAYAGWLRLMQGQRDDLPIKTRARWDLSELS